MFENEVLETDNLGDLEVTERAIAAQSTPTSEVERQTQDELFANAAERVFNVHEQLLESLKDEPSEALGSIDQALHQSMAKTTEQFLQAATVCAKKRIKRTEKEMIQALGGSALKEANYVADRVRKLEDKISELMGSVSEPARILVLKDNPHLSRY